MLDPLPHTSVSVVVPARNEVRRIGPGLAGLRAQGSPLVEVLVVDGGSTDGTRELVTRAAAEDSRFALIDEPPRDRGIVGRPWATGGAAGANDASPGTTGRLTQLRSGQVHQLEKGRKSRV